MCGIVGYAGDKQAVGVLVDGLSKLEYRGYDSAGVAFVQGEDIEVIKAKGRLSNLEAIIERTHIDSTTGIGHTRWATHGEPTDVNAHPHTSEHGDIALVHNGIIENYMQLKEWLKSRGVVFLSDTDTEVAAHLINYYYRGDLKTAVAEAITKIEGSYALAVIAKDTPDEIVAVRKDSPLVVGVGVGENLIASDIPAILKYTRDVHFLNDHELVVLNKNGVKIYDEYGKKINKKPFTVDWDINQAEKGGYEHFMIKEINEQPKALYDTLMPRIKDSIIDLSEIHLTQDVVDGIKKITIIACGTAYHAGVIAKYVIEKMARLNVEVDIGSEFRYREPILEEGQLVVVISQSGETADTIAAMREAKKSGLKTVAITNVKGSTVSREADAVIYTQAGLEIAVASTKAYITMVLAAYMMAMELGRMRGTIKADEYEELLNDKARLLVENVEDIQKLASKRYMEEHAFFLGRGMDYALAMEASLKLKEVSYVHSEAYASGELKHGTIALIDTDTLVVALATQRNLFEKSLSNIKEVKARGAYVAGICQERDANFFKGEIDEVMTIPDTLDVFAPILCVIPMQLFAYYCAVYKGCDVDKPRNLAKSVTVE